MERMFPHCYITGIKKSIFCSNLWKMGKWKQRNYCRWSWYQADIFFLNITIEIYFECNMINTKMFYNCQIDLTYSVGPRPWVPVGLHINFTITLHIVELSNISFIYHHEKKVIIFQIILHVYCSSLKIVVTSIRLSYAFMLCY